MAENQENSQNKYLLPAEKYSEEQRREVYIPKGIDDNDPVGTLPREAVFLPLMDRILGGLTSRKCAKWLKISFGIKVKYTDIQNYIDRYFPADVRGSINLASATYQNSKVDSIEIMEDLVRWQRERLKKAQDRATVDDAFAMRFDFRKEMALLHQMSADLLKKKQELGLLPNVPAGVVSAAPSDEPLQDAGDMAIKEDMNKLSPSQIGRLLGMMDSLKAQLKSQPIDIEVVKQESPAQPNV